MSSKRVSGARRPRRAPTRDRGLRDSRYSHHESRCCQDSLVHFRRGESLGTNDFSTDGDPPESEFVPAYVALLEDSDKKLRKKCATELGRSGLPASAVVPARVCSRPRSNRVG